MNDDFRKAVAYWLLAVFDIDYVESYSDDSGATKTTPLPQYYTARNEYMVQCIKVEDDIDSYTTAYNRLHKYCKFLMHVMKGTSDRWKNEILNFKP